MRWLILIRRYIINNRQTLRPENLLTGTIEKTEGKKLASTFTNKIHLPTEKHHPAMY
jgi:hypothetical protein